MKKTLVALSVMALSSVAMADTTIYQQDGSTLSVYGRFGAMLDKTEQTNVDLKDDESRIGFKVEHAINEDTSALGAVEFRFSDANRRFSDPTTHDAYAGLKHKQYGTLTLGRQATTADDIALSKFAYAHENVTTLPTQGDRTIKYRSADFGGFSFGADYTFLGSTDKDVDVRSRAATAGLFYNQTFNDVNFRLNAGYANAQYSVDTFNDVYGVSTTALGQKYKEQGWMVGSQIGYGDLTVGVDYSHSELKGELASYSTPKLKADGFQVAAKYQITPELGAFTAYQYKKVKYEDTVNLRSDQYTLGVDYKLHKNVVTYAQVDVLKNKDRVENLSSSDVGGAVGLRVYF